MVDRVCERAASNMLALDGSIALEEKKTKLIKFVFFPHMLKAHMLKGIL